MRLRYVKLSCYRNSEDDLAFSNQLEFQEGHQDHDYHETKGRIMLNQPKET